MNTRTRTMGRAALLAGLLVVPSIASAQSQVQPAYATTPDGRVVQVIHQRWEPGSPGVGSPECPANCYGGNPYSWCGSRSANKLGWHAVYFDARMKTNFLNFLGFNRPISCWKWSQSSIYPADPGYADARDGQVYSAQGYGVPVSVPLAPNVKHTYNYGWGVPSSRLTPVAATYQRYNPGSYGAQTAGVAWGPQQAVAANPPMIYMPTDTTQLGFYYAHVPSWQPVPRARWSEMQATPVAGQIVNVSAPAAAPAPVAPKANPGIEVPEPAGNK